MMTTTWKPPATPVLDSVIKMLARRVARVGNDPRNLPIEDQTVLVVYGAQGVIDNGGVKYFFESDWPGRPPYSMFVAAYRRIGAVRAAKRLDQAIRRLPGQRPHLAARGRNRFMDGLDENDAFFDDGICGDTSVWATLEEYARQHEGAIRRRRNDAMQPTGGGRGRALSRARRR